MLKKDRLTCWALALKVELSDLCALAAVVAGVGVARVVRALTVLARIALVAHAPIGKKKTGLYVKAS